MRVVQYKFIDVSEERSGCSSQSKIRYACNKQGASSELSDPRVVKRGYMEALDRL
jgi:hypothetical protein